MNTGKRLIVIGLLSLLAVGCAQSPVAPRDVRVAPYGPAHVLSGEAPIGENVVWGGRIVAIEPLADRTELVIASYPLDRADRPRIRERAGVRFVMVDPRFLEPVDWSPGRFVTVLGSIEGIEERLTGDHRHAHPVIHAQRVHLWPADPNQWRTQTAFSIGVGVRL
jgi:outer membrane lipoprotein